MNRVLNGVDYNNIVGVVLWHSGSTWLDVKRGTFKGDGKICTFEQDVSPSPGCIYTMRIDEVAISAVLLAKETPA